MQEADGRGIGRTDLPLHRLLSRPGSLSPAREAGTAACLEHPQHMRLEHAKHDIS